MLAKIKEFVKDHQEDIILVIGVVLISLLSFAAGYIVAKQQEKEPIQIEMSNSQYLISNKISNSKYSIYSMSNYWKLEIGNWKLL